MRTELTSPPARAVRAHALKNSLTLISAIHRPIESELSELSHERIARSQESVCRMRALIEEDLAADGRRCGAGGLASPSTSKERLGSRCTCRTSPEGRASVRRILTFDLSPMQVGGGLRWMG
jgi:hypothetical protein